MEMKSKEETKALREDWYKRAAEQTLETLPAFLKELSEVDHDYNTICYACAAAAVGATWAMDRGPHGGITGFQAGAIMWEYMQEWNKVTPPAWLLRGEDLLYPQYAYKFNTIQPVTWAWLQETAKEKLEAKEEFPAHPEVMGHWHSIRHGVVPFGLKIRQTDY